MTDEFKKKSRELPNGALCICGGYNCQAGGIPHLEKVRANRRARQALKDDYLAFMDDSHWDRDEFYQEDY